MSINIRDGYGSRMHSYGYGKHTSYADKIARSPMADKIVGSPMADKIDTDNGMSLSSVIAETAKSVTALPKSIITGGDNIWKKIKNKLFKDDHPGKNYRR